MNQLPLKLQLANTTSLQFFVPHSGTAEAIEVFEQCFSDLSRNPSSFCLVFLYGAQGAGKSHLISAYLERMRELGYPEGKVSVFNLGELNTAEAVRAFVDTTERGRGEGGFVIVEGETLPTEENELTPHVRSRLLSGYSVRIGYPLEEELRPLLLSILERRNLRLPEHSLQYLHRLLPTNPLSMAKIVSAVDDLALSENRKVGRGVIVEALKNH